jgi:hypothetical protein
MVIDLTQKIVALNVIIRLTCAIAKFSANSKIHMNRRLHEGHHFISMAMEVHSALGLDMDRFIKECARFFHDKRS